MKLTTARQHLSKGFTLIELIVVIAILGVLAAVLITTIDPVDKISAANDAGVISTVTQLGKANDTYAAQNGNNYPNATTFAAIVASLSTQGETKIGAISAPVNYTYNYSGSTSNYAFWVNLKSKKYTSAPTPWFIYANGKGCTAGSAPTLSTFSCP
jgi:type IV pilus assembly protein PilA